MERREHRQCPFGGRRCAQPFSGEPSSHSLRPRHRRRLSDGSLRKVLVRPAPPRDPRDYNYVVPTLRSTGGRQRPPCRSAILRRVRACNDYGARPGRPSGTPTLVGKLRISTETDTPICWCQHRHRAGTARSGGPTQQAPDALPRPGARRPIHVRGRLGGRRQRRRLRRRHHRRLSLSLCRTATLSNPCCVSVTPPATSVLTWSSIQTRRARSSASPWRARATWMLTVLQMSRSDGATRSSRRSRQEPGVDVYRGGVAMDTVPDFRFVETEVDSEGRCQPPGTSTETDTRISRSARVSVPRVRSCGCLVGSPAVPGHEYGPHGRDCGSAVRADKLLRRLSTETDMRIVVGAPGNLPSSGQGGVTAIFGYPGAFWAPGYRLRVRRISISSGMRSARATISTAMGIRISSSARRSPTTRSELSICSGAGPSSSTMADVSRSARFPQPVWSLPRDGRRSGRRRISRTCRRCSRSVLGGARRVRSGLRVLGGRTATRRITDAAIQRTVG